MPEKRMLEERKSGKRMPGEQTPEKWASKKETQEDRQRELTASRFIDHLQKSVTKKLVVWIFLAELLFIAAILFMTYSNNRTNARTNLEMLKGVYLQLYEQSTDFLDSGDTIEAFRKKLENPDSPEFEYHFNRFNSRSVVENEVILLGADRKLIDASFSGDELSDYRLNYCQAICYNVENSASEDIYVAVYFDTGSYSDYLFVKPVFDHGQLQGYISLFLIGADWNFYLSDENYDGVIIDERCNVIYRSKAGFADRSGKFYSQEGQVCTCNHERYWMESEYLPDYGVTIYSLVYYPNNNWLLIGMAPILLMGLLWYCMTRQMSRTMAEHNASQIGFLAREIRRIQEGDTQHRIRMDTNDEFDEVAHRINRMLDSVQELNERNLELNTLNSRLEMGQLEAQLNLHFLYNTLEIIRNLVVMDADEAEELIEKMVHILRYSVNNTRRDIVLREEMEYIEDYLYIQKTRFGDRFVCEIDLDEDCQSCMIPKLLLQPIIENSIKYGFRAKTEIRVEICGRLADDLLQVTVTDNGPGMKREDAAELSQSLNKMMSEGDSLGLHNISRRIFLQYGGRSAVQIESEEDKGFIVHLAIDQRNDMQEG